jgi:hypothetical protein
MDIWFREVLPNSEPIYAMFDVVSPVAGFLSLGASNSEPVQHLLAAFSHAYMDRLCKHSDNYRPDWKLRSIKHSVLAIQSLNSNIASSSTATFMAEPTTVFAVAAFNWVAQTRGDLRESAIHTATLRKLLAPIVETKTRAEIDEEYGPLMLHLVARADLLSSQTNTANILSPAQAEALQISTRPPAASNNIPDYFTIDGMDLLPTGFADLVFRKHLSVEACRLLGRLSQAWTFGLKNLPKLTHDIPAFAIAHSFGTATTRTLEQCLLVALYVFTYTNWTYNRDRVVLTSWYKVYTSKLTEWLPLLTVMDFGRDCLIWIWMVLVYAYCVRKSTVQQGLSCLGQFMIQFPTYNWNTVKQEVLPKFFWSEEHSRIIEEAQRLGLSDRPLD